MVFHSKESTQFEDVLKIKYVEEYIWTYEIRSNNKLGKETERIIRILHLV
jgi:hypothetical protein